jgi:hypothetical protein
MFLGGMDAQHPPEVVMQHLGISMATLEAIPKKKALITPA